MKPGPTPTPEPLKKILGLRIRKPAGGVQGALQAGVPRMPAWLSKEAKAEWRRITPHLKRLGLVAVVDLAALVGYCTAVGELEIATKLLAAEGRVVRSPVLDRHGTKVGEKVKAHPAVQLQRDAAKMVKMFACEFGLTPANRSRVTAATAEQGDDPRAEKYFGGFRAKVAVRPKTALDQAGATADGE